MRTTIIRLSDEKARALIASPEEVHEFLLDPAYPEVGIDKSWEVLHFALTGEDFGGTGPEAFLLKGGLPIGEEDLGFGPGRVFFANEVPAITQAIKNISERDLYESVARDAKLRNAPIEGELEYHARYLAQLRAFLMESMGFALFVAMT